MDIKLSEDMVDIARPGDRVSITGVARAQQEYVGRKARLRTFDLLLDANYVDIVGKEIEVVEITPEDERQIRELAKDPFIHRKLIASLAPSIYGYGDIKEAVLYLLFGGVPKRLPDGVTIRSEVNVLLVGDPGVAKSQLLQYVARIAPRGLYTSGRGTTAAGLTAAVVREKNGGMVLEAGALVLADKGVACIDEMDKMRPEDRVAIHEALEQHTVSVAKGGIVATLNARAAVLAAANPSLGRYDPYRNITDNINLPVTLLSRFDLLFIMKDVPEPDSDSRMSEHILALHRLKTTQEEPPLPPELLRKYIAYAKRIEPILTVDSVNAIKQYYLKMRSLSGSTESPIVITPRQLEGLVRLAESRARSFLRDHVEAEDAQAIIRLMTLSLQDVGIDTTTGKIDIDVIMTGKPKSLRDKMQEVLSTFAELEKQLGIVEDSTLYQALSRKPDITDDDARRLVEQLVKEGILYSPKPGHLKRTAA
jgi:replicative DNA helicase Mcm